MRKEMKKEETMDQETRRRIEIGIGIAMVALLYLLNWLMEHR